MVNPKEKTPILDCVRTLFEALEELDDFETLALRNCNKNHAPGLLHLVGHSSIMHGSYICFSVCKALHRVPTQNVFSNSLCFPCPTANFPCATLHNS